LVETQEDANAASGEVKPTLDDSVLEDLVNNKQTLLESPKDEQEKDELADTIVNLPKVEVSEEEANLFKEILGE